MHSIIVEMVKIIKAKKDALQKEQALAVYVQAVMSQLIALALQVVDDSLVGMMKRQGYRIDKKSPRNMTLLVGSVQLRRRRYVAPGKKPRYPLDELLGWQKYQRYSLLVNRSLIQLTTKMTYRKAAWTINHLTSLNVSHVQLNNLVIKYGKEIQAKQEQQLKQPRLGQLRQAPVLYLEGDGVVFKGAKQKQLEFHRFQVCEGEENITYRRRKRINARDFVSLSHPAALKQAQAHLSQHYDLRKTIVLSNADGGAGYGRDDFEELIGPCQRHEHFLDRFHLHQKIRDRLKLFPKLQAKMVDAVDNYNQAQVQAVLDTAESNLINELDTSENHEGLRRLRVYLQRHWPDIKPWRLRHLDQFYPALGSCESNHRSYTYRMKGQGRFWTEAGASAMLTIIACQKNGDLDCWLTAQFQGSRPTALVEKHYTAAARQALKQAGAPHLGVHQGAINTYRAGSDYLQKLNDALNRYS